jgi:hypothetical protein
MKTVNPKLIEANGLYNPWSSFKHFNIVCGECGHGYRGKVLLQEAATSICPACQSLNKWSMTRWAEAYEKKIAGDGRMAGINEL